MGAGAREPSYKLSRKTLVLICGLSRVAFLLFLWSTYV
jgi:hypothetical protein